MVDLIVPVHRQAHRQVLITQVHAWAKHSCEKPGRSSFCWLRPNRDAALSVCRVVLLFAPVEAARMTLARCRASALMLCVALEAAGCGLDVSSKPGTMRCLPAGCHSLPAFLAYML